MADSGELVLAIDQGTSSTKAITTDVSGALLSRASAPLSQSHPRPGWVEQDAEELFASVISAAQQATAHNSAQLGAIALSSQRESAVAWDARTGEPLGPVLGWQDRRTADAAAALRVAGNTAWVREASGLPIDPMFSALKFAWLLDDVDPGRQRSRAGKIAIGTVDSWIMFRLTGEHRIEVGNASRTQLLNLETADWDSELLELFGIPRACLPRVVSSVEHSDVVVGIPGLRAELRVCAVMGDSHAALYGHGVRAPGAVKVTYGTGSSVMGLLPAGRSSGDGLVRTIAWGTSEAPAHAFEGNILSAGSTITWLAELLNDSPEELARLAETASGSGSIFFVPAFSGLGSPWWDDKAEAAISGLNLGTSRADLARAAFESIPLQVEDILAAADDAAGARISTILADGGPSANPWLMQLQADLSQRLVAPADVAELSAAGAARMAGVSAAIWSDDDNRALSDSGPSFTPATNPDYAADRRAGWLAAVARSRHERDRNHRPLSATAPL